MVRAAKQPGWGADGAAAPVPQARLQLRLLLLALCTLSTSAEAPFRDSVMSYCYTGLVADNSCCRDQARAAEVLHMDVERTGASWECEAAAGCEDTNNGQRGLDKFWWTAGASCATPRILYVHGGGFKHHGPCQASYDVFGSKLAAATGAAVFVPDYKLVPLSVYPHTVQEGLLPAWRWLAQHGPQGEDCSNKLQPPLFLAGDESGGGLALSLALLLATEGTSDLRSPPASGFVGFSPWTNLECDTPTYYTNAFAAIVDLGGTTDYTGDITFRDSPRKNNAVRRNLSLAYVGEQKQLLTNPLASPFYATEMQLQSLPPLYFATSASEVLAGDTLVLATRAAQQGVPVFTDMFDGMWHFFPQFSEGCGSGHELWQGGLALTHAGDFVRQVSEAAWRIPQADGRFLKLAGTGPHVRIHYASPSDAPPWGSAAPLDLGLSAAAPSVMAAGPYPAVISPDALSVRRCGQEILVGAYFIGAAGGVIMTSLSLSIIWCFYLGGVGSVVTKILSAMRGTFQVSVARIATAGNSRGLLGAYTPLPTNNPFNTF